MFTLHWNTFCPTAIPPMEVNGDVGVAMVPLPLIKVHCPVATPTSGLPVTSVVAVVEQRFWSAPAFAASALAL